LRIATMAERTVLLKERFAGPSRCLRGSRSLTGSVNRRRVQ
jgi:hypothetical protein